ncbi:MAG: MBOAT family O-acyltransferase [Anaerovoracaceae bacterium]
MKAKTVMIASIVVNLGILCFFKYADFFVDSIALPIGISFFTFQTMSYTIDVYRGDVKVERSLINLSTYVCLFPQLIAGPIVRFSDISAEMHNRKSTLEMISSGIRRFVLGLGKKVLIANAIGELCQAYANTDDKSVLFVWVYAIAFTLQMYFDFSGYSDMAIGLGKIFGFNFPENFNYPYISKSITEFWRRWHMTLGGWFRDYVYIPLGGNRTSNGKWVRNVFVVWLLTGLWHGAYFNFAIWGLMYGVILVVEKLFLNKYLDKAPAFVRHIYVMFFVIVSFVIFNGTSMGQIAFDIKGMFGLGGLPMTTPLAIYYLKSYLGLFVIAIIAATPVPKRIAEKLSDSQLGEKIMVVVEPLVVAVVLIAVTAYLVDGSFNPFLYFRF